MSSIIQRPDSKYWIACYTDLNGRQLKKSTKISIRAVPPCTKTASQLRWDAEEVAREYERIARSGTTTAVQVRKVISDIHEKVSGNSVKTWTVREWFEYWLNNSKGSITDSTFKKYSQVSKDFISFLGAKADSSLEMVTPDDVLKYRDYLKARGLCAVTINDTMSKIVKASLRQAQENGYLTLNPVTPLKPLKDDVPPKKRKDFSEEEVIKILQAVKGGVWEGYILCLIGTLLRLEDAKTLKWEAVDLEKRKIVLNAKKTNYSHEIPMTNDFYQWLKKRPAGIGQAPVFPELISKKSGGKTGISATFKKIMKKAGVVAQVVRKGKGMGRTTCSLSLHSIRHYGITKLDKMGVSLSHKMAMGGHTQAKTNLHYTHVDSEMLDQTVQKLNIQWQ